MKIIPKGSNYVPAVSSHTLKCQMTNMMYNDIGFRFFDKGNSFFDYDMQLINAYDISSSEKDNNHRSRMKYPDDMVLIGDSGGFQIMMANKKGIGINIDPIKILRWMENNADIGMNLDSPPTDNFEYSLRTSIQNFELFQNNRENYIFKLYNILHGKSYNDIITWYSHVKDFDFDGWAIGIRPHTNTYLKILSFLYLLEHGEESIYQNTHFFGISSMDNMIALSMLSKKFDLSLTFDSSTWATGYRFSDYYFPLDVRHKSRLGQTKNSMKSLPCDCPVCQSTDIKEIYKYETMTPSLISYHNLYNFIETNRMINVLVDDIEALFQYGKSVNENILISDIVNILNDFDNYNTEYIYSKYKKLFVPKPENRIKPTNLFRSW